MNFKLFASCFLVSGAYRSLIADVQRQTYYLIPNALYIILKEEKNSSLASIMDKYSADDKSVIREYFDFLFANELIFWCNQSDLSNFPEISLDYKESSKITNAIVDIDTHSDHDFRKIFNNLDDLGCKSVQIRSFDTRPVPFFENLLQESDNKMLVYIEILMKDNSNILHNELENLTKIFSRLQKIIVHSASKEKVLFQNIDASIIYTEQLINSESHCGIIHLDYFSINLGVFIESQGFNTCLNRKISVCKDGKIRNCPSLVAADYGNINDTSLTEAFAKDGFTDIWSITKDQISICQDCEFRHICTDCRAYIQNPKNIFSKPAKCGYDPYTATWGELNLSDNPLYGQ